MAGRGRIISPDFWSDGNIVRLSPFARLFFIGMWNFAYCDKGHLPDDAWDLKLKILPADDVDPVVLLAELVDNSRVVRATVGGRTYLTIPTFGVHQKADDPRWTRKCPVCLGDKTLQTTTVHDRARPSTTEHGVEGNGVEGNREGGGVRQSRPPRYCPQHPNGTDGGCFKCRDARIAQQEWDAAERTRPTPSVTKAIKYGDGHACAPDEYGNCPKCGTKVGPRRSE